MSPAMRGLINGRIQAAKSYAIRSKKARLRIDMKQLLDAASYRSARDIFTSKIKDSFDHIDDDCFLKTLIQIITDKNQVWIGLLEDKPDVLNQWVNRLHDRNLTDIFCNMLTDHIKDTDYVIDESQSEQTVLYDMMAQSTVNTKNLHICLKQNITRTR